MTVKFKKSTALLLSIAMLLTMVIAAPVVSAASYDDGEAETAAVTWSGDHYLYFYDQLTPEAKRFYDAMKAMYETGTFKTGTGSYDLVANHIVSQEQLAAYANGDNTLLNTYGAARDAFFADYPEVFYVNTDNLTITVKLNARTGYKAVLGAGRTDNYYRKGFDSPESIDAAMDELNKSIDNYVKIANEAVRDDAVEPEAEASEASEAPETSADPEASKTPELYDLADLRPGNEDEEKYREKTDDEKKITAVHNAMIRNTRYKLDTTTETDPKACRPENIENVRTAYGPLVAGESLCEGYSRGFKCIMDKLHIPCVLVQGIYKHGDGDEELHMWNMVQVHEVENDVWYAVDSTFDDPSAWNGVQIDDVDSGHESTEYLLVGADIMDKQHVASGEMSECQFVFKYPALEMSGVSYDTVFSLNGLDVQYTENSGMYFGTDIPAPVYKVSYNGKGYEKAAREDGIYILVKQYAKDTSTVEGGFVGNSDWVYADTGLYFAGSDGFETEEYTLFPAWQIYYAEFAITKVPPKGHWYYGQKIPVNPEIPNPSPDTLDNYGLDRLEYQYYKGDTAGFEAETGLLYNPAEKYVAPPYIKRGTPSQSGRVLIQGNMEIDCEYSFDQPLEQFAPVTAADGEAEGDVVTENGTPIELKYGEDYGVYVLDKTENNASLDNIKVEEAVPSIHFDGDRTVTFKFRPDPTWASDCVEYLIVFKTMRGVVSKKIPNEIGMVTSFPCAACAYRSRGYFWNVHAKPQLISDSDIDISGWTDSNGEPVDPGLSHRLSLVVSETSQGEQNAMNELLEENGVTPKASSMYNINLTVCKCQVPQPGQGVRVMMGFPAPYGPDDAGVKFTAYHYIKDDRGNTVGIEKIPCEVTPYGLVILCKSFSPFAVVVTEKTNEEQEAEKAEKTFVVTKNNGGSVAYSNTDADGLMKITEAEPVQSFTVTPDQGYVIEQISIGSDVKYSNPDGSKSGAETVNVNFNDYKDLTAAAMVSVKFAPQAVLEKEAAENEAAGDTTVVQVVPNEVPEEAPPLPSDMPTIPPPEATPTPEITATPEPQQSEEPVVSAAPEPEQSEEPVVSEAPEQSEEPVVSAEPEPEQSEQPVETATPEPEQSEEPVVSEAPEPEQSEEPAATTTPEPEQSEEPAATATPEPEQPVVTATPEPEQSEEPAATATPEPEQPVVTATPEPEQSEEPAATATPKPEHSEEPAVSAEPEQSEEPAVSAEPGASSEPEPTFTPRPTRRPTYGSGGGGGGTFTTGNSTAAPKPTATADPNATANPNATAAPGATQAPDTIVTSDPTTTQVFTDVPADHWAYSYIMDLYNAGIINGESETLFVPDGNITRAEFTKIATLIFELPIAETTSKFADVGADDWYAPYVSTALDAGIINGTSETTFSPDDNITREQIAAIVGRFLNASSQAAVSYSDAADIEDYALPYVAALSEQGVLTGSDGMFNPKSPATRAEAAAIADRIYQR